MSLVRWGEEGQGKQKLETPVFHLCNIELSESFHQMRD
jgi:hypothetical protein